MKNLKLIFSLTLIICSLASVSAKSKLPVKSGLVVDLNANLGITTEQDSMVTCWRNQAPSPKALDFKMTEEGRTEVVVKQKKKGTGRPTLKKSNKDLNGNNSLSFRSDELINDNDEAMHGLMTGKGYTWFAVIKPYVQSGGPLSNPRYPNAFFGCLKNSGTPQREPGVFAGFWGCFYRDGTVYMGSRNGLSKTTRDKFNTPELTGPKLTINKWYIVMGRQGSGTGTVMLNLFVDDASTPVNSVKFPVGNIEPSRLAIGTERNAINHQGGESFDGELARLMIFERDLNQAEMEKICAYLKKMYF